MDSRAHLGRWIFIVIIAVLAFSELTTVGLSLLGGQFRVAVVVRILLTVWLLWKIWDGAGWARWLMAVLSLVAAVFAAVVGLEYLLAGERPETVVPLAGALAVCLVSGLGLASPWVGAYQAARRKGASTEQLSQAGQPPESF